MKYTHFPKNQGLYDPQFEHDSCGVGFVCDIKGRRSNSIVRQGSEVLRRLSHRGAVGADPKTGDGAGILIQIPHRFLQSACSKVGITLPSRENYGAGLVFLPKNAKDREFCTGIFEKIIKEEKQIFLGWRDVPRDNSIIGKTARDTEPVIHQAFIKKGNTTLSQIEFERKLYIIRKRIENEIRMSSVGKKAFFYITNLSSRTLAYKGLLMPEQLDRYFLDLQDECLESSIALVHSRYSTNTFPTWDLSQPFRFLAHNGEINTLRGNIIWMRARESLLQSAFFGKDIEKIKPIIIPGGSDSATIDNVFELLSLSGRSLSHAMAMLIPPAWENNKFLSKKVREFYQYNACMMEPWDGPAAIAFTDGTSIGAVLDRNGLRPARYVISKKGLVVMASEVGVLESVKPQDIKLSGRLEPGKMLFIDTGKKRIISDEEVKRKLSQQKPYGTWLRKHLVKVDTLDQTGGDFSEWEDPHPAEGPTRRSPRPFGREQTRLFKAFGYTREDMKFILKPMAEKGLEPIGSMGNDTPHAVLSKKPRLLYDYFKQLFAQVTNPAIDPIREELIMSLESYVGRYENILNDKKEHCHKLLVKEPILENAELDKIKNISMSGFKTKVISVLFKRDKKESFEKLLDKICKQIHDAINKGYSFIVLTDKGVNKDNVPLPALMVTGAVHHYLVREALRTKIGLIVESGEPREVHHFALLFGYGADCINPYLAYEALGTLKREGELEMEYDKAVYYYRKALHKGILKILSKMGISTLRSYRAAQIFEVLGLNNKVIEKCFEGTASRIEGAGFEDIREESIARHSQAYPAKEEDHLPYLSTGGVYQWKKDGEFHLWNPDTIATLQDAVRRGDYDKFKEFARLVNNQEKTPATLRGLLKFRKGKKIPLEEVEPAEKIVKRFATGAMSFGSISKRAHETLAVAMNRIGARSNTGEGGEDPMRFVSLPRGDYKGSAIKQVASGRFGVVANYLVNADELQIKIAQGAKPGEGGQLPGHKVSEIIARTRYTTPGVTLISPPPHHDIYSIEDLAQLIFDLKNVNPRARISVKLVSEVGVGTIAAGVAKGHADMILISGGDGGTGASPLSSIRHAGLPWELGLSETHQTLLLNDLRSRVRIQADGQIRTGRDIAIAALLGAEEYGFATAPLVAMGCVMLRHCHLNNCSVGVATQDEMLERRFKGQVEHVVNYFTFVTRELREIMAELGMKTLDEAIGRTDLLEVNDLALSKKTKNIDYSNILYKPDVSDRSKIYRTRKQHNGIKNILDKEIITLVRPAMERAEPVKINLSIENKNRATGAMLSGEVCRQYGEGALPDDTISCKFTGFAGQSFGAFLARGITFELEGMTNDYVGKGLSGGKIIIYADKKSDYKPEENILIGNTTFYGATSGEAYISGKAGERFCIRNSGLYAVSEGVGDHGCEYMTGGRVVILGKTGRNFGAGMSGGIAYVYDKDKTFKKNCNMEMISLESLNKDDKETVKNLLYNHHKYTGSLVAKKVVNRFSNEIRNFVKVMPLEYKLILEGKKIEEKLDLLEPSDG